MKPILITFRLFRISYIFVDFVVSSAYVNAVSTVLVGTWCSHRACTTRTLDRNFPVWSTPCWNWSSRRQETVASHCVASENNWQPSRFSLKLPPRRLHCLPISRFSPKKLDGKLLQQRAGPVLCGRPSSYTLHCTTPNPNNNTDVLTFCAESWHTSDQLLAGSSREGKEKFSRAPRRLA